MMNHLRKQAFAKQYLFASDFDKTLSFNDSGHVLSELLGIDKFAEKVEQLSKLNLVQQGGELAYLLVHDSDFRDVRKEHLQAAGKRIQLKANIELLSKLLEWGIDDHHFSFCVISAAPEEVIQSALSGVIPANHIFGTRFRYDEATGAIAGLLQVPAGYGKVATLRQIQAQLGIPDDRLVYTGDGTSDIHVILHVNQRDGFTVAASEARDIAQIARRTVISDDALSVLVPILEDLCEWDVSRIKAFFEAQNVVIQEWGKVRTDWLTLRHRGGADAKGNASRASG